MASRAPRVSSTATRHQVPPTGPRHGRPYFFGCGVSIGPRVWVHALPRRAPHVDSCPPFPRGGASRIGLGEVLENAEAALVGAMRQTPDKRLCHCCFPCEGAGWPRRSPRRCCQRHSRARGDPLGLREVCGAPVALPDGGPGAREAGQKSGGRGWPGVARSFRR